MDKKTLTTFTIGILLGIFLLSPLLSFLGVPGLTDLLDRVYGGSSPYTILVLIILLLITILLVSEVARRRKKK